jgi:TRAP-type C4-dicarboxylate transport system permease small subunit
LRWFVTAFDRFEAFLAFLAGILLSSMLLLICYAVLMRYFFLSPPGWIIEVTEDILLYITFLGAAWLLKERGHVSVDLIYERLNPKTKIVLDIIISIMGVIICLIMTWYSAASTWDHFQRGAVVVETLKMPKAILLGVIPIGFFTLSIEFIKQTHEYMRCLTSGRQEKNAEEKGRR